MRDLIRPRRHREDVSATTVSIVTGQASGEVSEVVVRVDPNPRPVAPQKIARAVAPSPTVNLFLYPGYASYPSHVVWFVSDNRGEKRFRRIGHGKPGRAWGSPRGDGRGRGRHVFAVSARAN